MTLKKIVSGGQTGVDRGALDAALVAHFSCGGWVTWDRMAEDGVIPERYPMMPLPVGFAPRMGQRTEVREGESHATNDRTGARAGPQPRQEPERRGQSHTSDSPVTGEDLDVRTARPVGGNYRQRTRLNVSDSDGTAILYSDSLTGGTRLTRNLCALLNRPYILINAREAPDPRVAAAAVLKFIEDNGIEVLNVAGPRASGWSAGHVFSFAVLREVIEHSRASAMRSVREGS